MEKPKIIKNYCQSCQNYTRQFVLKEHNIPYEPEGHLFDLFYQIVECCGCSNVSFREEIIDPDSPIHINESEVEYETTIKTYPVSLKNHKEMDWFELYELPLLVRRIYTDTLKSYANDSKILTGIGLRTCIEAVCNDKGIEGKSLESRINKLKTSGFISISDTNHLHGIRFMGNDSAHDIKQPNDRELEIALRIVEHLLSSIYILPKISNGTLQTVIDNYKDFKTLLIKLLNDNFKSGDEHGLFRFLDKDYRRCQENIEDFEKQIIKDIQNGDFTDLQLGAIKKYKNKNIQNFLVV